ncbi:MAG: TetR/AcrR family transcriptional regulator [Parvibaculaceae bacterium]|nr:TetR/AcrR family transcriptional regulator [Parvibaculaceae bacterium]
MNKMETRLHEAAMQLYVESGSSDLSVSELAKRAGVARGTVYNNLGDPDRLYPVIVSTVVEEMNMRIRKQLEHVDDTAEQLSIALKAPLQRMMDEPLWGKFLIRFALLDTNLRSYWGEMPAKSMEVGIKQGRFDLNPSDISLFLTQAAGATFAMMILVTEGQKGWQEAATELVNWQLRALGLTVEDAQQVARKKLPQYKP